MSHPVARHPLVRRITGYSAGSVVAVAISEIAFTTSLGWGHVGTTIASAIGFVGGAVPNYILNRRWAWRDRRGRNRRSEVTLYMVVALATFLVSAVATHLAKVEAEHLTSDRTWLVVLAAAAFLAVSAVFFVVKFVIYETVVFRRMPDNPAAADGTVITQTESVHEDGPATAGQPLTAEVHALPEDSTPVPSQPVTSQTR